MSHNHYKEDLTAQLEPTTKPGIAAWGKTDTPGPFAAALFTVDRETPKPAPVALRPGATPKRHAFYVLEEGTPAGERHATSLLAFLESGRRSRRTLLLSKERRRGDGRHAREGAPARRDAENAARLAWLTTELFRDHRDAVHLESIELSDLFVEPESHEGGSAPGPVSLRVGILPSAKVHKPRTRRPRSDAGAMPRLGTILYSLFALDGAPPAYLSPTDREDETKASEEADDDIIQRLAKCARSSDAGVFSRLMEDEALPTSVCRLLADLIDADREEGKPESSFQSFDGVMEDLEQMISRPDAFLHDPVAVPGAGSPVMFGRTNYGRQREAAVIREVTERMRHLPLREDVGPQQSGVKCVFVSGIAGSGKSVLVQEAVDGLQHSGWIPIKSKFERSLEHASSRIASSMFDELVAYLVNAQNKGGPSDVAYSQRVSAAVLDSVGLENLSVLSGHLPSLPLLFPEIGDGERKPIGAENYWQLVHCISKVLAAMLEQDRFVSK